MEDTVLFALVIKLIEKEIAKLPAPGVGPRGARGFQGRPGEDGKSFDFEEHKEEIRSFLQQAKVDFNDLTPDQIESLRGQRGRDGNDGRDFAFEEHEPRLRDIAAQVALKFSDLTPEELSSLRGERGPEGRIGRDGKDFSWEDSVEKIDGLIRAFIAESRESLRLRFEDLDEEQKESLRGPRGREGRDGKSFDFEEHREFFESLRLKFSDLSADEVGGLKLKFSQLTDEERDSLKMKFSDLTDDDINRIRGPRGQRGKQGIEGEKGDQGVKGDRGPAGPRGSPGVVGVRGLSGLDGSNGRDGKDAPYIVSVDTDQGKDWFTLLFQLSNGKEIETPKIGLPKSSTSIYHAGSSSGGGGDSGSGVPGEPGEPGEPGPPGADGFAGLKWNFAETMDGEPEQGTFQLDNADPLSASELIFNPENADGQLVGEFFNTDFPASTRIYIQNVDSYYVYDTSGMATEDENGNFHVGVSPYLGYGGFAEGTTYGVLYAPAGVEGVAGEQGPQGPAGLSAYEIAVENGFVGTEEEWLESLSMAAAKTILIDKVSGTLTYIGYAVPGSDEADPVWKLQSISIAGDLTTVSYADGDAMFNNVWNDRASYTYS